MDLSVPYHGSNDLEHRHTRSIYSPVQLSVPYSGPKSAPFNGRRCCSEEPHMSNGVTGEQRASGRGTTWGAKPADNALLSEP